MTKIASKITNVNNKIINITNKNEKIKILCKKIIKNGGCINGCGVI